MSTTIEWTRGDDGTPGMTWNPVTGCSKVSPGCAHCYAERLAPKVFAGQTVRIDHPGGNPDCPVADPDCISDDGECHDACEAPTRRREFTDVRCHEDRLDAPLHWKKPRRVFVNSMSDLFHEDVPDAFILEVFRVMKRANWHTYQVLTKRARRMRDLVRRIGQEDGELFLDHLMGGMTPHLDHVWLGVSVENQHFADERIPLLLQTPAAIRFISAEPLLGPLDLFHVHMIDRHYFKNALERSDLEPPNVPDAKLDWVIVGGESGPGARPFDLAWARSIVQQCQAASVPVFVKQLGRYPRLNGVYPDSFSKPSSLHDKKGGDPAEWPEDLRVREFPCPTR